MKLLQILAVTFFVMVVSGCQSQGSNPEKSIVGSWTSDVAGFPIVVEYIEGLVRIDGYADVPYKLDKNSLSVAGVTRILSFPSADEMIQTDPLTNTDQKFFKVK